MGHTDVVSGPGHGAVSFRPLGILTPTQFHLAQSRKWCPLCVGPELVMMQLRRTPGKERRVRRGGRVALPRGSRPGVHHLGGASKQGPKAMPGTDFG
ncbi:hypothetical protein NicSoilC12_15740 [Arthrobacter sp. NicSoilC12]|nr:hypothetical protein NicSoilC12_15740 [Arthrobacter sp. NicSoilC12]